MSASVTSFIPSIPTAGTVLFSRPGWKSGETFILGRRVEPQHPAIRSRMATPTAAELIQPAKDEELDDIRAAEPTVDPVKLARDARIALLARRYEKRATVEDEARFQILTERLRRLAPVVTARDLELYSTMLGGLERADALIERIRARRAQG